jgi:hypothetical protein
MSRYYPVVVVGVLAVLLGVNLWFWPDLELQRSATSFGVGDDGYKAAYDLLSELGLSVNRTYIPVSQIPTNQPLWLVSPSLLDTGEPDADPNAIQLLKWIRAGGTAIVFGEPGSAWKRLGITAKTQAAGDDSLISGDFTPIARDIPIKGLLFFSGSGKARVRLHSGKAPFALELPLGAGRLIAVADGRFMRNANLGHGDASVLVFDLARALGTPIFDERSHGLAAAISLPGVIITSRAVVPLGLGLLAALLWLGEQRRWPRRTLAGSPEGPQPSIGAFVDSLGVLYSRANDPQAVFRAYRAGFVRRLGKQFSPRAELTEDRIVERLAGDRTMPAEIRRRLVDGVAPRDERELVLAVRAIESYSDAGR